MLYKASPKQGTNQTRRPLQDCRLALNNAVKMIYTKMVAKEEVRSGPILDTGILKVGTMEFADEVGMSQRKSRVTVDPQHF